MNSLLNAYPLKASEIATVQQNIISFAVAIFLPLSLETVLSIKNRELYSTKFLKKKETFLQVLLIEAVHTLVMFFESHVDLTINIEM